MLVIAKREPGDKQGPDIVGNLLVNDLAGEERGRAEVNLNDSPRKIISANGPKNEVILPTKLVEVIRAGSNQRGISLMYSRSYNISGIVYTIDSSMTIQVKANK